MLEHKCHHYNLLPPDASRWVSSRCLCRRTVPKEILSWLIDRGSLTSRLQEKSNGAFRVHVLSQSYHSPHTHERRVLKLESGRWCFIRQVHLLCNHIPVVYARTVIPIASLTGPELRLTQLGTKSLGGLLFSKQNMIRDELQIACITRHQGLYREAVDKTGLTPENIWGRRSAFYLNRKKLLVSEIFLPTILNL